MSLNPGGRISGPLHLAKSHPKIAACVAALGLTVVAWTSLTAAQQASAVTMQQIEKYCEAPNPDVLAGFPKGLQSKITKICVCHSNGDLCSV
jgi:hypothetical protein